MLRWPAVRFDCESTGWLASFGAHLALLAAMAVATLTLPAVERRLDLLAPKLELEEPDLSQDFFSSEKQFDDIGALSQDGQERAMAAAYDLSEETFVLVEEDLLSSLGKVALTEQRFDLFESPDVMDDLAVQGVGNVGTKGAAGAIDRLTHEIVKSLQQQPTLVVWLFDQSGSLP